MTAPRLLLPLLFFLLLGPTCFAQENLRNESVTDGQASPQPIALTLKDAIDRGLKNNLAVITGSTEERVAAAERLRDLSELLPRINGRFTATQEQTNLAAFGFSGIPGLPQIIGPFALVDARASLSQPVVDLKR